MKTPLPYIQEELTSDHNPEKATWFKNYVKHDIRSGGVSGNALKYIG
jgi:hypothetical protein